MRRVGLHNPEEFQKPPRIHSQVELTLYPESAVLTHSTSQPLVPRQPGQGIRKRGSISGFN